MGDEYDNSVDVSDVDTSSDSSADYSVYTPSDDFSENTSSDDYGETADDISDEITEDTYDGSTTDLAENTLDVPEDIESDETEVEVSSDIPEEIEEDVEPETTEELKEIDSEVINETTEVEPADELAEETEVVDEIAEAETTEELVEEEVEAIDETAEVKPTDELVEEADVVGESPEAENAEENKELPFDNTVALNADSNETPQQTASWRGNVKKANPIKAAGIAAYMGAALKADEAGYKTVRGYATRIGGGLAVKAAGKLLHLPPVVEVVPADSVKTASHLYDVMYAAKYPEAVLNFKPSPVAQEIIDKNTLVLDEKSYTASMEMPDFSIETQPPERSIPGTPGVVNVKIDSDGKTGNMGNSSELSKNLWKSFEEVPRESYDNTRDFPKKAKGYQAQHIIPVEMHAHPVLQKIGMDMNDSSNGIFLPEPNGDVHALTTHKGYHAVYNKVCEEYLDKIYEKHGEGASVEAVEADVAKLQQALRSVVEDGNPIYRRKKDADKRIVSDRGGGVTEDLLRKAIERKLKL